MQVGDPQPEAVGDRLVVEDRPGHLAPDGDDQPADQGGATGVDSELGIRLVYDLLSY